MSSHRIFKYLSRSDFIYPVSGMELSILRDSWGPTRRRLVDKIISESKPITDIDNPPTGAKPGNREPQPSTEGPSTSLPDGSRDSFQPKGMRFDASGEVVNTNPKAS